MSTGQSGHPLITTPSRLFFQLIEKAEAREKERVREEARKQLDKEDPLFVIGSPPCTMFSVLQELFGGARRADPKKQDKFDEKLAAAVKHMEFCCEVYRQHTKKGGYVVHEHPWGARSWKLDCIDLE